MNSYLTHSLISSKSIISIFPKYAYLKPSLHRHISPLYLSSNRNFSFVGFYTAVSESAPVQTIQKLLLDFHETTGLPWWGVIALSTLGIRALIVFPLAVHQHQVMGRLAKITLEIGKTAEELNREVNLARRMYNWDEKKCKSVFRRQFAEIKRDYIVRDNCHPFKVVLLVLIQVPMWICFSFSLRNMTYIASYHESAPQAIQLLKTEGILWFQDLTVPDTFFLPFLLLTANLALIEIHAFRQVGEPSRLQTVLLYTSRAFSIAIAAAATLNPSSVSFYWLCSSSIGIVQNLIILSPKFRRLMGIPTIKVKSEVPVKTMK